MRMQWYIYPLKRTISVKNTAGTGVAANNNEKEVVFKNCAPFGDCISEINNTYVDHAKDVVIPM